MAAGLCWVLQCRGAAPGGRRGYESADKVHGGPGAMTMVLLVRRQDPGGATTNGPDATTPQLSVKTRGGGGGGGRCGGGVGWGM